MGRYEDQLGDAGPRFVRLIEKVPLQDSPPLPRDWLRCEMLERIQVLRYAEVTPDSRVLEVGSGPHAITTVPLAFQLGSGGVLIATERSRWGHFRAISRTSGMERRIRPITCNAGRLPLRDDAADLAVCVHGIRSLESEENMVRVFREMLRIAPRIFLAESLPIASTDAQRAHLAMYELREEVLETTTGHRDDLRYLPLNLLTELVERAGGSVASSATVHVDLPHALAHFPRDLVESIPDRTVRDRLRLRWDEANSLRIRFGEDHPPVGVLLANRS